MTERNASVYPILMAYRDLSDKVCEAVKGRFTRGSIVHWTRQGYRQRGEVKEVLGFQAHNLRLHVLNTNTGKYLRLYLYEIEEASK